MAFTAISWTKLTSNQSSVTISVPSGYRDIMLKFAIRGDRASEDYLLMQANSITSSSYAWHLAYTDGASAAHVGANLFTDTSFRIGHLPPSGSATSNFTTGTLYAFNYADSTFQNTFTWTAAYEDSLSSGNVKTGFGGGYLNNTSAVTNIKLYPGYGTNLTTGSTFALYGWTNA